jgi:hypothetical protein
MSDIVRSLALQESVTKVAYFCFEGWHVNFCDPGILGAQLCWIWASLGQNEVCGTQRHEERNGNQKV